VHAWRLCYHHHHHHHHHHHPRSLKCHCIRRGRSLSTSSRLFATRHVWYPNTRILKSFDTFNGNRCAVGRSSAWQRTCCLKKASKSLQTSCW
jgi:hypothetical protein